jgi:rubrerythrin
MPPSGMKEGPIGEQELFINRSGIMVSPEMSAELIQGVKEFTPSSEGDAEKMRQMRADYIREAPPIGSYPEIVNEAEADAKSLSPDDTRAAVLLDKLGERLAFERQGTRLYQAFIQKLEAMPVDDGGGPTLESLRHICDEELEHFKMLQQAIVDMGGDATVQTPSADVAGVLSLGALQVMSDPRTTIGQALQAALTAELSDNDGWQLLEELAEELGHEDLGKQCAKAFEEEQEHLDSVRSWIANITLSEAVGADAPAEVEEVIVVEEDGEEDKERRSAGKRSAKSTKKSSRSKARKKKR